MWSFVTNEVAHDVHGFIEIDLAGLAENWTSNYAKANSGRVSKHEVQ